MRVESALESQCVSKTMRKGNKIPELMKISVSSEIMRSCSFEGNKLIRARAAL
jgi:hypothetical protein